MLREIASLPDAAALPCSLQSTKINHTKTMANGEINGDLGHQTTTATDKTEPRQIGYQWLPQTVGL